MVASFRRARFTHSLALECAERGYRATTVAHVVARARSSRNTFYEDFGGKEALFLALMEQALAELEQQVDLACAVDEREPAEMIEAGLRAVLEWVAGDPAAANAVLVEAPAVSPQALQLQARLIASFSARLRACGPPAPGRDVVAELLVEGVASILRFRVVAGQGSTAPILLPSLTKFLALPLLDG